MRLCERTFWKVRFGGTPKPALGTSALRGIPARALALLLTLACSAPAATITSTWNGATANWTDFSNWSTSPVFPNNDASDSYNAVINAGAVTLNQNIVIDRLTLGGGALDGAFSLTALAGLQWTGGAIRGSGALALAGASTITGGAQPLVLSTRTINHSGSATFSAGTIRGGSGATLNNLAGATITALGNAAFFADPASPAWTLNNAGTFVARSSTGAGFTSMDAAFHNSGAVRVELTGTALSHTLSLAGGGTHSGSFDVQAGTTVEFGGNTILQTGATITGGGTAVVAGNVVVSGNISAQNLAVANGELNVGANTFTITGTATQTGGTIRLGSGIFRVNNNGSLTMDDGILTGTGTLDATLNTQGTVAPGSTLGTLNVTRAATFGVDAHLAIELGGTTAGSFDLLAITQAATLGGMLDVRLVNGFMPAGNATFTILTASGVTGFFTNAPINGGRFNTADGLGFFAIDYTPNSVVLTGFIPEPSSAAFLAMIAAAFAARRFAFTASAANWSWRKRRGCAEVSRGIVGA